MHDLLDLRFHGEGAQGAFNDLRPMLVLLSRTLLGHIAGFFQQAQGRGLVGDHLVHADLLHLGGGGAVQTLAGGVLFFLPGRDGDFFAGDGHDGIGKYLLGFALGRRMVEHVQRRFFLIHLGGPGIGGGCFRRRRRRGHGGGGFRRGRRHRGRNDGFRRGHGGPDSRADGLHHRAFRHVPGQIVLVVQGLSGGGGPGLNGSGGGVSIRPAMSSGASGGLFIFRGPRRFRGRLLPDGGHGVFQPVQQAGKNAGLFLLGGGGILFHLNRNSFFPPVRFFHGGTLFIRRKALLVQIGLHGIKALLVLHADGIGGLGVIDRRGAVAVRGRDGLRRSVVRIKGRAFHGGVFLNGAGLVFLPLPPLFPHPVAKTVRGLEQPAGAQTQENAEQDHDQRPRQQAGPDAGDRLGKGIGDQHARQPPRVGVPLQIRLIQAGGKMGAAAVTDSFRLTGHIVQIGQGNAAPLGHPGDKGIARQHQQIQGGHDEKVPGGHPVAAGNEQLGPAPRKQKGRAGAQGTKQA